MSYLYCVTGSIAAGGVDVGYSRKGNRQNEKKRLGKRDPRRKRKKEIEREREKASINVPVFRTLGVSWMTLGLWFLIYHPESAIVRRAPALTLCERVFLLTSTYTCTLCPLFCLDPSDVGFASPCTC